MTDHDKVRAVRAVSCDHNDIESLRDAIRGLQSTDDPSLVPLHDELMERYQQLMREQVDAERAYQIEASKNESKHEPS